MSNKYRSAKAAVPVLPVLLVICRWAGVPRRSPGRADTQGTRRGASPPPVAPAGAARVGHVPNHTGHTGWPSHAESWNRDSRLGDSAKMSNSANWPGNSATRASPASRVGRGAARRGPATRASPSRRNRRLAPRASRASAGSAPHTVNRTRKQGSRLRRMPTGFAA